MFNNQKSPSERYELALAQILKLEKTLENWYIYEVEDVDAMERRLQDCKNYVNEYEEMLTYYGEIA